MGIPQNCSTCGRRKTCQLIVGTPMAYTPSGDRLRMSRSVLPMPCVGILWMPDEEEERYEEAKEWFEEFDPDFEERKQKTREEREKIKIKDDELNEKGLPR